MEDASCMSFGAEMEYWSSLGKVIMFGLQLHGKCYIADWEETNDVDWQHFTGEGLSVRVGCIRVASILY